MTVEDSFSSMTETSMRDAIERSVRIENAATLADLRNAAQAAGDAGFARITEMVAERRGWDLNAPNDSGKPVPRRPRDPGQGTRDEATSRSSTAEAGRKLFEDRRRPATKGASK